MIRSRACGAIIVILIAYLALALPLPMVLLDHELGVLTGDPAHTVLNDHAWLDHAAGSGITPSDGGILILVLVVSLALPLEHSGQSADLLSPSGRGPLPADSIVFPRINSLSISHANCGVEAVPFVSLAHGQTTGWWVEQSSQKTRKGRGFRSSSVNR